jgi:iron complex transport system ATP-binding protein
MLTLDDFTVAYGAAPVIRSLSDRWPAGQVTALIGCNGAGKSTLLKAMAGLLPCSGRIGLDGAPLSIADRRRTIAYMPQDNAATSSLSVIEVVLLGRLGALGMRVPAALVDAATQALAVFGLLDLATRRLDEISGGQRQLVFLAQALFRKPRVLLLDEPTAALDLRHQLLVLDALRRHAARSGTVVAVAMHDLNLAAQYADRLLGLKDGTAIAAGPAELVLTEANLAAMYGIEAEVSCGSGGKVQVIPLRATPVAGLAAE